MTPAPAWARRFHTAVPDAPALLCLPHAGGSASAYFELSARLRPEVDVRAVQYPGRQDRSGETPVTVMEELVERLADAIQPFAERPYALFGHSMGAVVAYELALRLRREGVAAPLRLFVSGRRAPSAIRDEDVHRRSDDGVIAHVRELGGVRADVLDDPEIRAMVLPALRADYTLVETYRAAPGERVTCPVTVLVGDEDPLVTLDEARLWKEHTEAGFELEVFTGGHFYLTAQMSALAEALTERLLGKP
ncbi:alpha/beta fold hydrolase [Streptomyces sp. NPDC047072]|uniref:thioesterase II family protein n=1 Tax=Streptomyces sp. NPDC047072 TaxID=3154809 RepID=UPI0033D920D4